MHIDLGERRLSHRMKRMLKRIARHKATLIIAAIRLVVYAGLFLAFFGLMSVNNWQLLNLSRTLATTLLTYVAMTAVMHSVYGGFDVGRKKNKPVISSMVLSTFVTDAVTYLQLQIMNVNDAKNDTLVLFGSDFSYLIVAFVLQCLLIWFSVRIGNNVYFHYHPPRRCLVILDKPGESDAILRKIGRYRLQWKVERVITCDHPKLRRYIRETEVVFLGTLPAHVQMNLLHLCYDYHRDVICKAQLEDIMLSSSRQIIIDDAPFLAMEYHKITLGQRIVKRLMDICISALLLLVFSPVLLIISVCILLEDGRPVIFRQERLSVRGRKFSICKFRTMSVQASQQKQHTSAASDDARITRVGKWLRKFRLDEFPQFWNILRGDMTLVGPRPEMLDNISRYKEVLPSFVYREKMKAGLTGYAQIEGRYNTTPEDKVMLDLMYIESFSIRQDIKLLFRTLTVFFKSDSTQGFEQIPVEKGEEEQATAASGG